MKRLQGVSVAPADVLRSARALVFDFDGTLVDSNPIKRQAFERCFADAGERREEILAYCLSHHHTPRGEKFRHVYERILGRPYTEEVAADLHERFEAATTRQIIDAPEIPGAGAFLQRVHGRYVTALLSSTPQETLLDILARRGWGGWFGAVQGAPVHKASWLKAFRRGRGLEGRDVVFFGDTQEDAAAADEAGCFFLRVGEADGALRGLAVSDFTTLLRG